MNSTLIRAFIGALVILIVVLAFKYSRLGEVSDTLQKLSRNPTELTQKNIKENKALGEKSQGLILDTKTTLQDQVDQASENIKNIIEKAADSFVDDKKPVSFTVSILDENNKDPNPNLVKIDFLKDRQLQFKTAKNSLYHFKLLNVPVDFCFYIQDQRYTVEENKIIAVEFLQNGNFTFTIDYCNRQNKDIGRVDVE